MAEVFWLNRMFSMEIDFFDDMMYPEKAEFKTKLNSL